jgi:DNA polymerase elongation subunit (family B)
MYVDAIHDRESDTILVAERIDGKRVLRTDPAEYTFYHTHTQGSHKSIFGDVCKKFSTRNMRKFRAELETQISQGRTIFESHINPVFRYLSQRYMGANSPTLNIGYFDIEAGFDKKRGFAPPSDPFNEITAISLQRSYDGKLLTYALRPPSWTEEMCAPILAEFPDTFIFDDEADLLRAFLEAIEDCDVLTGWNSESYDVPYLVNRVKKVLGKDAVKAFCLWGKEPKPREYVKFQKTFETYEFVGRVHLDLLLLYQKHNPQQEHSYSLDAIGEVVVGERKTPYEGTLDDLYHKDFHTFIRYSRQDVALLAKIDEKKKYIELSNVVAHANCVLLKTTMGSVALVEQAIINEMHAMGLVAPDKRREMDIKESADEDAEDDAEDDEKPVKKTAVGAYVAKPKIGIHTEIACCDINSLYPSAIRALNMSPETIVGQVRQTHTEAEIQRRDAAGVKGPDLWEGIFSTLEVSAMHERDENITVTVDFDDGTSADMTAAELYDLVFGPGSNLCITANGTLFRTDKEGIIPALLAKWYAERKDLQKQQKEWDKKADAAKATGDKNAEKDARYWEGFYNQRQQAKKILLNSLYGALLNPALLFFDSRLGQSTTLSGRCIVKHMNASINETLTGEYDHSGTAILYADTDSCYFSVVPVLDRPGFEGIDVTDRDFMIAFYDGVADAANDTFPEFMAKTFNTSLERGAIIKAGRELVASRGLFIKKKKYGLMMYEFDGNRYDVDGKPGKTKVMGLDLKRADTPKTMQTFLSKLLTGVLTGAEKEDMYEWIKTFRSEFQNRPGWEKGTPKKVNGLTAYKAKMNAASVSVLEGKRGKVTTGGGKVQVPAHVLAGMNWNKLCDVYDDRAVPRITDGSKVIVCKLKPHNTLNMDAVAYPIDIDAHHLPDWFKELPFNDALMEQTIVDMKLENLVGVLNWDMSKTRASVTDDFFSFT